MTSELTPEQVAANAAQEQALLAPETSMTPDEAFAAAAQTAFGQQMDEYESKCRHAVHLSSTLSARQLGRVLRAILKAPFESNPNLVSNEEKMLFKVAVQTLDRKTEILLQALKAEQLHAKMQAEANPAPTETGNEQAAAKPVESTESKGDK